MLISTILPTSCVSPALPVTCGRLGLVVAPGLDHDVVLVARPEVPEDEPAVLAGRVCLQDAADTRALRATSRWTYGRVHHSVTLAPAIRLPRPVGHQAADPDGVLRVDRERELALAWTSWAGRRRSRWSSHRRRGPTVRPCRRGRAGRGGTRRRAGPDRRSCERRSRAVGHEQEHLGPGDRMARCIDDDAVESPSRGELQVGPGPVGLHLEPGEFAVIESEIRLRHVPRLDRDLPRSRRDRVPPFGVGRGLAARSGSIPALFAQQGIEADPGDALAGLGVDDPAGDRREPLEWDLELRDGAGADLDLVFRLGGDDAVLVEIGIDHVSARRQVVELERAVLVRRGGLADMNSSIRAASGAVGLAASRCKPKPERIAETARIGRP